jgi:hypothetical protein
MRGILNSGHTRAGAYVIRTIEIGGEHIAKRFSTWAPKAIASIGGMADTISDRSIILAMQRKTKDQKVERLRRRDSDEFAEVRRKALRWTQDNQQALAEADDRTKVPAELHDRAADNWRLLITIADRAGGEWSEKAREAARALSGEDAADSGSLGVQLLADIRAALRSGEDFLTTKALIGRLIEDPERPWADYRRGKPLSPKQLGALLGRFGIASETVHPAGERDAKGYVRTKLEDAWKRYLPPSGPPRGSETSKGPNRTDASTYGDFRNVQTGHCGRIENNDFAHSRSGLDVWTDKNPGGGGEDVANADPAAMEEEAEWTV